MWSPGAIDCQEEEAGKEQLGFGAGVIALGQFLIPLALETERGPRVYPGTEWRPPLDMTHDSRHSGPGLG